DLLYIPLEKLRLQWGHSWATSQATTEKAEQPQQQIPVTQEGDFPVQTQRPYQIRFSAEETQIIDSEILKYLSKHVIEPVCVTPESFVSTIFIRPKKDG
ncbi:Hypothetical predicted protein, partial [Paramuricea clavata]